MVTGYQCAMVTGFQNKFFFHDNNNSNEMSGEHEFTNTQDINSNFKSTYIHFSVLESSCHDLWLRILIMLSILKALSLSIYTCP